MDPLMAKLVPLGVLGAEYEGGSGALVKQIGFLLAQGYEGVRRSRGDDGNCFYRSLIFAYMERIFGEQDRELAVAMSISTLESLLPKLAKVGWEKTVIDEYLVVLRDLITAIVDPEQLSDSGKTLTPAELLEVFQDDSVSTYLAMFMRMVTGAQIRSDPEEYGPFLTDPDTGGNMTVREFCETFVEVPGEEADHVQVAAMSRALKVNVKIAYLDGRSDRVEFVTFNNAVNENETPLTLLFRPGHYDILDRRCIHCLSTSERIFEDVQ